MINRKLYWGLGVLSILLGTAFVFIMQRNQAEIRELERQLPEAEKLRETGINPSTGANKFNQRPVVENRPPPPGKTFANGGHWHGDEWHDAPHVDGEVVKGLTFSQLPEPLQKHILERNRKVSDTSGELDTHNIPDKKKVNHEELMKILQSSELTKSEVETLMSAFRGSQYLEFENPIKSK